MERKGKFFSAFTRGAASKSSDQGAGDGIGRTGGDSPWERRMRGGEKERLDFFNAIQKTRLNDWVSVSVQEKGRRIGGGVKADVLYARLTDCDEVGEGKPVACALMRAVREQ